MTGNSPSSGEGTSAPRTLLVRHLSPEETAIRCEKSAALSALVAADVSISQVTAWHHKAGVFASRVAGLGPSQRRKALAVVREAPRPITFGKTQLLAIVQSILSATGLELEQGSSPTGLPTLRVVGGVPADVHRLAAGGWLEVFAARAALAASDAVTDAQVGAVYCVDAGQSTQHSEFDAVVLRGERLTLVEAKAGHALLEKGRPALIKAIDNFLALEQWRASHSFAKAPRFRLLLATLGGDHADQVRAVVSDHGHDGLVAVRTTDDYAADFTAKGKGRNRGRAADAAA